MRLIPLWSLCLAVVLQSVAWAQISPQTVDERIHEATEKREAARTYLCDGDYHREICYGEDDFILGRVAEFQRRGDLTPAQAYAQKCNALTMRLTPVASSQYGESLLTEGGGLLSQAMFFLTNFDYDNAYTRALDAWDKFNQAWQWSAARSGKLAQLASEYKTLSDEVEKTFGVLYPNG